MYIGRPRQKRLHIHFNTHTLYVRVEFSLGFKLSISYVYYEASVKLFLVLTLNAATCISDGPFSYPLSPSQKFSSHFKKYFFRLSFSTRNNNNIYSSQPFVLPGTFSVKPIYLILSSTLLISNSPEGVSF